MGGGEQQIDDGAIRTFAAAFDPAWQDVASGARHVPRCELEGLRRGEPVVSAAGFVIGQLDGVVQCDLTVTHLVLQPGHEFGDREIVLPIGQVRFDLDPVLVRMSRDAVEALPPVELDRSAAVATPAWRSAAGGTVFRTGRRPRLPRRVNLPLLVHPGSVGPAGSETGELVGAHGAGRA